MGNIVQSIKNIFKSNVSSGRFMNGFFARKAGVIVSNDSALSYSPIWRAIHLISGTIGTLPWNMYIREPFGEDFKRKKIFTHPAASLLYLRANDEMSAQTWRETMIAWALSWGNGYSEIERDYSNRPVALWPIDPDRVTPSRIDDEIVYVVRNDGKEDSYIPAKDMFHLHGLGFNGLVGYSPIGYHMRTVGLGIAAEEFGSAFFENGAAFSGVFEHPSQLGDKAIDHLRESLHDAHGGPYNAGKPLILEEGMKFSQVSIPPSEAQYIESRKFTVYDVARIYGVPPHKLMEMDKSTFNNIEHQSIEFVTDSLISWILRLENEANYKLVSSQKQMTLYSKMNLNSLLRGDTATRSKWYKDMSSIGVYSVNEIRELEDENTIGEEGDKRLVQMNLTTLDRIGEEPPEPEPEPEPTDPDEEEEEEDEEDEEGQTVEVDNRVIMALMDKLEDISKEKNKGTVNVEVKSEGVIEKLKPILSETIERVVNRESYRASSSLKRYSLRTDMVNWMEDFYAEHIEYMNKNLSSLFSAMDLTEKERDDFIEHHVNRSRLSILEAFDNGENKVSFDSVEDNVNKILNR